MEELDQKQPAQAIVGHYRNKVVDGRNPVSYTHLNALGFEFAHLGINCENVESSTEVSNFFQTAFDFPLKDGSKMCIRDSPITIKPANITDNNFFFIIFFTSFLRYPWLCISGLRA